MFPRHFYKAGNDIMMQLASLTQPYCPHSFSFPFFHHLHPLPKRKEGRKEGRIEREGWKSM
jgi:hypothetical protein